MFLQEQAAAALEGNDDKEIILQRLLRTQECKEMYQQLHHVFKPNHAGAISHLELRATDGWQWPYDPKQVQEWKREYDTKKVEELLFERNITHFGQSKETPWTQSPFSAIPFTGTGPIADSILQGTYQYQPTGPTGRYIKLLLEQLKRKLPNISTNYDQNDIAQGFKSWKEITSTSPSNRHLRPDGRKTQEATKELAQSIMQVHYKMTALCTKLGISLHRWQKIVTTMLEKEPGHPKLHRLQAIHLLEADLNLLIKILLARRFVWHAEDHAAFGEAQAGSQGQDDQQLMSSYKKN
jgi:hypothetical protein